MALINITPSIKDSSQLGDYKVIAKSTYSSDDRYQPYRVFDGIAKLDTMDNCWISNTKQSYLGQWIEIQCSKTMFISKLILGKYYGDAYAIKTVDIEISFDGVEYTMISEDLELDYTKTIYNAPATEIVFKKVYFCKYLRITCKSKISRPDLGMVGFSEIEMYYDDSLLTNDMGGGDVSHTNGSLIATLPMNTTKNILAKTSDPREGLLGMANDQENYGDLYVVGGDGKSHLTKGGTKSEIIFEGEIDTTGQFNLKKDVTTFKYILVQASFKHQTHGLIYEADKLIDIKTLKSNAHEFILVSHVLNGINEFVSFTFKNDKIVIDDNRIVITKIIGIY